ncbi:sugar-binding transcriptional regulator [Roseicitreum antarcticum]|uniref:Lsr operon transcriptional repressor n=1 Tax=Roseicitreum antarcticum TaxID=564137 RepID=A0A1H2Z3Z9_9RHOB|nr:sugar-binding transcriptional regulator [Roseicitreum antarcticum]SDX12130.1 lsr operon transcriptional repressor [Roseicitreum antarcticum]
MKKKDLFTLSDDDALLARVAWYYYHDGLTQQVIGEKLGLPRIKVSRMLENGRRTGMLEVRINSALQGCLEIEQRISDQFGLTDVRVIPQHEGGTLSARLGQAAAQYLMHHLTDGGLLAVGWGETVGAAIDRLGHLMQDRNIDLVAMTGGVQAYVEGLRFAGIDRNMFLVPAPLVVETPEVAQAMLRDTTVRNTLDMAMRADFALVGIGALDEDASVIRRGYIHPTEVRAMRRGGAVGDVLCRFIDDQGQELAFPLHDRVIGLPLASYRDRPRMIAAAGGLDKVPAIRAALKGDFIDIFVTDEVTANALMA